MISQASTLLVRCLLLVGILSALVGSAAARPGRSDSSDVVAAGGETSRIVYYRYLDTAARASNSAVLVWEMRVRDGGSKTPDLDSLPTVLDSLCIHVGLNDDTVTFRTRSIAWAGLYADSSATRPIAVGSVGKSTIVFSNLAGADVSVPDDSARTFLLFVKFVQLPVLGDQFNFSVGDTDVAARGAPGHADSTSLFGSFPAIASETSGKKNYLTSIPKRIDLRSFPSTGAPGTPMPAVAALLDTFDLVVPDPVDTMRAGIDSPFGVLDGFTAAADSDGIFHFDSLTYSDRNDSATITLRYPDADSTFWTMIVTGGAPNVPTVTHVGPWSGGNIAVDGTDVWVHFPQIDTPGSFLTERIESAPSPLGTLPINVRTVLPRYIRITADSSVKIDGGIDVAFPMSGILSFGAGASLYMMSRGDSTDTWRSPAVGVQPFGIASVIGHVDGFGEVTLGGTSDVAVPVDAITLSAEPSGERGVRLRWRLAASVASLGFEVLRSVSSEGPYVMIATYRSQPQLSGAGNDPFAREFVWVDRDSALNLGDLYYYKIREVKQDGRQREVGPVAARVAISSSVPAAASGTAPFPNPFTGTLTIPVDETITDAIGITLSDPLGRIYLHIMREPDGGAVTIDGSALPAGVYLYRVETPDNVRRGMVTKISR